MKSSLIQMCIEIEKEIHNSYIDKTGLTEPIVDGIVDIDEYLSTNPKILWILKEPYDDFKDGKPSGGGWHFSKDFLSNDDFYYMMGNSRRTWHPIIYIIYSIMNGYLEWEEMPYIRDENKMTDVIKKIAVINVSKLPGYTQSEYKKIHTSFCLNKDLLIKQIKTYNPDIIIGGNTLNYFFDSLGIKVNDIKQGGSANYILKEKKIFIDAYHPACRMKKEIYVNDIVNIVKNNYSINPFSKK